MSNTQSNVTQQCIVCLKFLPEAKMSREHVFPDAIGGALCINSVCKECNDKLGHSVDCNLTEDWYVARARIRQGLWDAKNLLPVRYVQLPEGFNTRTGELYVDVENREIKVRLLPLIEVDEVNSRFHIHLDRSDQKKKYSITNKKLAQKGAPPLTNKEIDRIFTESEIPGFEMTISPPGAPVRVQQAMTKIAYELAWYWLGDEYLHDSTGELIRRFVGDSSDADILKSRYPLLGEFRFLGSEGVTPRCSIFPDAHLGMLWEQGGLLRMYVRVFSVYEIALAITSTPYTYKRTFSSSGDTSIIPVTRLILSHAEKRKYEELR